MHLSRPHAEHNGRTMPFTDVHGGLLVRRKVDVNPLSSPDPFTADADKGMFCGAMEEDFGWDRLGQGEVNRYGVPLVGADAQTILADGKTPLVTPGHNLFELFPSE